MFNLATQPFGPTKGEYYSPIYAKVNHLTNKPSINVLRRNNFKEYLPIVDNSKLPKEFDESDCFDKEYGMIFIKN